MTLDKLYPLWPVRAIFFRHPTLVPQSLSFVYSFISTFFLPEFVPPRHFSRPVPRIFSSFCQISFPPVTVSVMAASTHGSFLKGLLCPSRHDVPLMSPLSPKLRSRFTYFLVGFRPPLLSLPPPLLPIYGIFFSDSLLQDSPVFILGPNSREKTRRPLHHLITFSFLYFFACYGTLLDI